jgi:hypothetical protein
MGLEILTYSHGDVAAALMAQHGAEWCERLIDELLALLPSTLDGAGITALARQLAQADSTKASLIAEALWSEAMDVEHAQLQADDDWDVMPAMVGSVE